MGEKVSRRDYLKVLGGTVGGLVVGAAVGYLAAPGKVVEKTVEKTVTQTVTATATPTVTPTTPTIPTKKVHLDFCVWSYSVETIQDNIQKFMREYPNIEVTLHDFSWGEYRSAMIKRFTAKTPTDVLYMGEDWLYEFAKAGWIVPLEDYWDKYSPEKSMSEYKKEFTPYARVSMTYEGKIYGLPYYSDFYVLIYNKKMLEEAGYDHPPEDLNELTEMCTTLKQKGICKYPYIMEFRPAEPTGFFGTVLSLTYGMGGRLFNEKLEPIFAEKGSPFYDTVKWIVEGIKNGIINPDWAVTHETDAQMKFGAGEGAFSVLYKYNLAAVNDPATNPRAGQFKFCLMPGKTHETYGFAKFYALTKMCVDRGDDAIWSAIRFIEYFGGYHAGQYIVAKRWALEKGLGFGILPLYDDPDVIAAINKWGDVELEKEQAKLALIEPGIQRVWFAAWNEYARKDCLARAFAGEISVDDAISRMAAKWDELKAKA